MAGCLSLLMQELGMICDEFRGMKMQRRPKEMNKGNMIGFTERANAYVKQVIADAKEIETDARKAERLEKHECKACFYNSRIGGASMTSQPCMSCHADQMYGSTNTDALCKKCAEKHGLCKHCGGDLEMRTRRKEWPTADIDA